jgi:2-polyprenyl-3-methyl-5-hydroxy-6-metoxy-1,4-benzoquinol methylase
MSLRITVLRAANRLYRRIKTYLLLNKPPLVTPIFFRLTNVVDKRLSGRKQSEAGRLANTLWKQQYFQRWQRPGENRFRVVTMHPIAYSSDDHRFPRGTILDNSVNERFNCRLYELLGFKEDLKFLDLGCAGGGLVRSYLEDGYMACGLEGSDSSKKFRSGEWDTIPYHLFTADITKEFSIIDEKNQPVQFDAVTAWDVFEHIPEDLLDGLISGIGRHLRPNGYFIGSIDLLPDGNPLTGAVYHKTLRPKEWWNNQFSTRGFRIVTDHPLVAEDMVRGNGQSLKDWHPSDGFGVHIVVQKI